MTLDQCRHWWELGEAGSFIVIVSAPHLRMQVLFIDGRWVPDVPMDAVANWEKYGDWQVEVIGDCPVTISDGAYRLTLPNKRPLEATP